MNCADAQNLLLQIDSAIQDIDAIPNKTIDLEAYLAKFLTVFICGIYEASIEAIMNDMAGRQRITELENFVSSALNNTFRNPDISNICAMLKRFNDTWSEAIRNLPEDNKQALNSIVANKNSIAHGLPCSITLNDIKDYHAKAVIIIHEIDALAATI